MGKLIQSYANNKRRSVRAYAQFDPLFNAHFPNRKIHLVSISEISGVELVFVMAQAGLS